MRQINTFDLFINGKTLEAKPINEDTHDSIYSIEFEYGRADNRGNGELQISIYTQNHIRNILIGGWCINPTIQVSYDWKAYYYRLSLFDINDNRVIVEDRTTFGTQSSYNLNINVIAEILKKVNNVVTCSNRNEWIKHSRSTPKNIQRLQRNEIFVFGSDLYGNHIRGAAELARKQFGAIQGQKVGIQGNSYAIPVSFDAIQDIKPYVDDFIIYAQQHSYMKFMVIRIGCGMAGFTPSQIAPLFYKAMDINNIYLPKVFWDELLE